MKRLLISALALVGLIAGAPAQTSTQAGDVPAVDRYKDAPLKRLVEAYVLDVIGALPPASEATMERLNLQRVLKTRASGWRQALRESLHFSDTFDTAILDLWFRWQDAARSEGKSYPPEQFAAQFADNYFEDGSQIDVWPPGALEAARHRIAAARAKR